MGQLRVLLNAIVVMFFFIQAHGADKYTDQSRPYEFGFTIDGQQHRHEKKDKNGIIMGEFGFITADDVYHVTVYATDEQGRFRILSMKNIHLKKTQSVTSARQGHSLQIPSTHQVSAIQLTTTTIQPTKKVEEEFEPISLEPPVNSCSHCSLPTTSTEAPKPLSPISQSNSNNLFGSPQNRQQIQSANSIGTITSPQYEAQSSPGGIINQSSYGSIQQNPINSQQSIIPPSQSNYGEGLGPQSVLPSITNRWQGITQSLMTTQVSSKQIINGDNQNYLSGSEPQNSPVFEYNNYQTVSEIQQNYSPNAINGGQSYKQNTETQPKFTSQANLGGQNYLQGAKNNNYPQVNGVGLTNSPNSGTQNYLNQEQKIANITGTQQRFTPQQANGEQRYPQGTSEQNFSQEIKKYSSPQVSGLNYPKNIGTQQTYQPKSTPQAAVTTNGYLGANNQKNELPINKNLYNHQTILKSSGQAPGEISPQSNIPGVRTSKQFFGRVETAPLTQSQKPSLAYAQMQIVDKNTDIHAKAPGEKQGLPEGLTENDMVRLLYTFNYTLGFQGHFEEGYSNGLKQGYYFVTGRNGVRTRIDYTADDKGFHPKISQDVLDLLSDDVPKPETEKEAKYGLKGYEFKWLYYPVDLKRR